MGQKVNIVILLVTRNRQLIHIFPPPLKVSNCTTEELAGQGLRAMTDMLDFREEARGCLHLAQVEGDPDVKTLLMGMALGWLTLADHMKSEATLQFEHADDA